MVSAEHKSLVVATVNDTVEVLYNQGGTDTTSNPFIWKFNLDLPAKAIFVKSDTISQIVEINNHLLKSPINIPADGAFTDNINGFQHMKYTQLKVKILNATTNLEVFGRI